MTKLIAIVAHPQPPYDEGIGVIPLMALFGQGAIHQWQREGICLAPGYHAIEHEGIPGDLHTVGGPGTIECLDG